MVADSRSRGRYAAVTLGFVMCVIGLSVLRFEGGGATKWVVAFACVGVGVALCGGAVLLEGGGRGRPRTVTADVTLTQEEVRRGAAKTVTSTGRASCDDCEGTGLREQVRCRRCRGSGLGRRGPQSRVVWLAPGSRHKSIVRLRGLGKPGRRGRPAGDLLLTVRLVEDRGQPPGRRPTRPAGARAARPAGTEKRDTRIRSSTGRSVADDAFLVTVVGDAAPQSPPAPPRPRMPTGGPVTILSTAKDTEFSVDASGITVRDKWPRPGGAPRWRSRVEMRWEDISALVFDYGSHDSAVSLYATIPDGGGRRHVVDSRAFTDAQWKELAPGVAALSGGRLTLDISGRDHPGPARDS